MNPVKNQIAICNDRSKWFEPGGSEVTNFITKDTTSEAFNAKIAEYANYKLENGGFQGSNALGAAAMRGNFRLVTHIVHMGGDRLLNLGNRMGMTPLYCAVFCEDKDNQMLAVQELINLGADVNISTTYDYFISEVSLNGSTPLWAAAEKTKNLVLVKLLLRNGAIKQPENDFSEEGKQIIKAAEYQIKNEKLFLAAYVKPENHESIIQTLPPDLVKYLFEFIEN